MYHPSNNDLMRTNILTKSSIVRIEGSKFKGKFDEILKSDPSLKEKDPLFFSNLERGHLFCAISSRPGQVGSADGYILQGKELAFYTEKFKKKGNK